MTERDTIEYDVVVVGGGPAGLATAIRLRQLAAAASRDLSVCLLEKGAEIGAHTLSGAVLDPRALDELIPGWQTAGAPEGTEVVEDSLHLLISSSAAIRIPGMLVPPKMHNGGKRIVSLGALCRWLGAQAEALGVDLFAGFAAASLSFDEAGAVSGVLTSDRGLDRAGAKKPGFEPGIAIAARQVVLAEGARGHLGRGLIERFSLAADADPQHYALGLKEVWNVAAEQHQPGRVIHGAGWPLASNASGGFFCYHYGDCQVAVGLIVDLNYANPWLDPFAEFQRLKHHPLLRHQLAGGTRVSYGARAIAKGGINSLPQLAVPGAVLVGCDAGTLDFARVKGIHTAMKSGMIAAETIFEACETSSNGPLVLDDYRERLLQGWVGEELHRARNVQPALHRFGLIGSSAFVFIDQTLFRGRLPWTLHDNIADHQALQPADRARPIDYPAPDGVLSFDRSSSVYLSGTNHEEDQPSHLQLQDSSIPVDFNLPKFAAPEQRYCPAGVYEIVDEQGAPRLQVNAQNCLHCKACDIKDPRQNIAWVPPEDGGPVYSGM